MGFGWDYNHQDMTRIDYGETHWNKLWAEYKNTMFDTVSGRIKYQYLKRDSTLNFSNNPLPNGGANNPNFLLPFTSAFDYAVQYDEPAEALSSTGRPMANTGVSFEANWAKVDFDDVTYGRTSNDRQGYFLSGYWNVSEKVEVQRVRRLGGNEVSVEPPLHRHVAGGPNPPPGYCTAANPNCYDPSAPPSANNSYNWNSQTKDTTWMLGVGADWQATDALKLTGSYLYVSNEGNATFGFADRRNQRPARYGSAAPSTTSTTASSSTST